MPLAGVRTVHLTRQTVRCQMNMVWLNKMNLNDRRIYWAREGKKRNARHEICITLDIVTGRKNEFDRCDRSVNGKDVRTHIQPASQSERYEWNAHKSLNWKVGQTNYTFFNTFPTMTAWLARRINYTTVLHDNEKQDTQKKTKWKEKRVEHPATTL